MENKNKMTLEELEKQYNEVAEKYESISKAYAAKKKEEDEKKREALATEKESRKKEIEEVEEHLCSLIAAYIKDYGSYSTTRTRSYNSDDDFPYLWHWFF